MIITKERLMEILDDQGVELLHVDIQITEPSQRNALPDLRTGANHLHVRIPYREIVDPIKLKMTISAVCGTPKIITYGG